MNNYTFENIIINPKAEGIEKYIGKEVYFGDTPMGCLHNANINNRASLGILTEIREKFNFPFRIDRTINIDHLDNSDYIDEDWNFLCFIPKKEDPEPGYIPFIARSQFLDAYRCHRGDNPGNTSSCQLTSLGGIWLKSSKDNFYTIVTEIYDNGVVTRPDCGIVSWKELCEIFVFPDGTPCGYAG